MDLGQDSVEGRINEPTKSQRGKDDDEDEEEEGDDDLESESSSDEDDGKSHDTFEMNFVRPNSLSFLLVRYGSDEKRPPFPCFFETDDPSHDPDFAPTWSASASSTITPAQNRTVPKPNFASTSDQTQAQTSFETASSNSSQSPSINQMPDTTIPPDPKVLLQIQLRDLRRQNTTLESRLERAEEELGEEKELTNNLKQKTNGLESRALTLKDEIEKQKAENVGIKTQSYEEQVERSKEISNLKEKIIRNPYIKPSSSSSASSPDHPSSFNSSGKDSSNNGIGNGSAAALNFDSGYSNRERGKFELGQSNDEVEIEGENGPDLEAYLLKRIQERRVSILVELLSSKFLRIHSISCNSDRLIFLLLLDQALGQGSANQTYTNASSSSSASNPPKAHLPSLPPANPTLNQASQDPVPAPKTETASTPLPSAIPRLPPMSSSPSPPSSTTPRLPSLTSSTPLVSSPLKRKLEESDFNSTTESPEKKSSAFSSEISKEAELSFKNSLGSNPFKSNGNTNGTSN